MLRLASQQARALAALGDEFEATQALHVAGASVDSALEQQPDPGVFYFPPGKAAYYAAETHIALGGVTHLRQAVTDAEQSLDLFAAGPGRSPELVAAAQLDLVTAHVALENLDSGAEHLAPVLQLPVESGTLRLGRYADSQTAAELGDQLDQFVAYSAAGGAPQLPA